MRLVRPLSILLAASTLVAGLGVTSAAANQGSTGTVTVQKVDEQGRLLPGASFFGLSCTRWDNDLDWQCQSLNDYSWFNGGTPSAQEPMAGLLQRTGTTGDMYGTDIPMRGGWALPIQQCVVLKETAAPSGYIASTQTLVVCMGPGGWTEANAEGALLVHDGQTYVNDNTGDWTIRHAQETRVVTTQDADGNSVQESVDYPVSYLSLTNKAVTPPVVTPPVVPPPVVTPPVADPATPPVVVTPRGIGANTGVDV